MPKFLYFLIPAVIGLLIFVFYPRYETVKITGLYQEKRISISALCTNTYRDIEYISQGENGARIISSYLDEDCTWRTDSTGRRIEDCDYVMKHTYQIEEYVHSHDVVNSGYKPAKVEWPEYKLKAVTTGLRVGNEVEAGRAVNYKLVSASGIISIDQFQYENLNIGEHVTIKKIGGVVTKILRSEAE